MDTSHPINHRIYKSLFIKKVNWTSKKKKFLNKLDVKFKPNK